MSNLEIERREFWEKEIKSKKKQKNFFKGEYFYSSRSKKQELPQETGELDSKNTNSSRG